MYTFNPFHPTTSFQGLFRPNGFSAVCFCPPTLCTPPWIPCPVLLVVFPRPSVAPETVCPRPPVAPPTVLPRPPTVSPTVFVTPPTVLPTVSPSPPRRPPPNDLSLGYKPKDVREIEERTVVLLRHGEVVECMPFKWVCK